jgi:hypothetical protein
MTGAEIAVRTADKVEREINCESLRAIESQGSTTIAIGYKPPYRSWPAAPMGGWRCLRLKTLRPRVPVDDTLQEVPKEGQQEEEEEEDAVKDAPGVGAAAMATEVWGSWRE